MCIMANQELPIDVRVPDGMSPIAALRTLVDWTEVPDSVKWSSPEPVTRAQALMLCECSQCVRDADVDNFFTSLCDFAEFRARDMWFSDDSISRNHPNVDTSYLVETEARLKLSSWEPDRGVERLGTYLKEMAGTEMYVSSLGLDEMSQDLKDAVETMDMHALLSMSTMVKTDVRDLLDAFETTSYENYKRDLSLARTQARDLVRDMKAGSVAKRDVYPRWVGTVGEPALDAYEARLNVLSKFQKFGNGAWAWCASNQFWENVDVNEMSASDGRRVWKESWDTMRDKYREAAFPTPKGVEDMEVATDVESSLELG